MTRMMILLFTLVATTVATDVDLRMARLERKLEDLLDQVTRAHSNLASCPVCTSHDL